MSPSRALPYSTIVRPEDTERASKTVTVSLYPSEAHPKAVDFRGTCPRCGHAIQEREWLVAIKGAAKMTKEQQEEFMDRLGDLGVDLSNGDVQFDLVCGCREEHPKRSADKHGCGASFRVRVTWP